MEKSQRATKTLHTTLDAASVMLKFLVVLFFAFPFFWMISTAFKTLSETLQYPPKMLPGSLQWENFVYVFQKISIGTYLKNSIIVAVAVSYYRARCLQPIQISL